MDVTDATTVTADEWHHVVFQREGSALSLWLDGQLDGEMAFAHAINDSDEALKVGASVDEWGVVPPKNPIRAVEHGT